MMRQLRESTKWIMLATALAFVGLMVFQWGMDITGQSGGGLGTIGRVNGVPVPFDLYESTRRNLYDQIAASQEEPITSQQSKEIEDQAWDEVVNQILIGQELERRGITVTDEEIKSAANFSPPPQLQSDPAFQTDGAFDLQKYQTWMAGLPTDVLLELEAYYRSIIPRGKLLRQVGSGVFPSDGELWQAWKDRNESVRIRFVAVDPADGATEDIAVSDGEIQRYYDGNQDEFEVPARARLEVVVLPKTPTAVDSAAARTRADSLRGAIEAGADFAEVARTQSTDQGSASLGGSLGTFAKGRMVAPFDSAVWAVRIGQVSAPVQTSFGWHLIRVDERWADSATASHILIPVQRTDASEIALLTLADSLEALAEERDLAEAARQLGLGADTIDLTADFPFASGAGRIGEGMDWALEEAEPGEASPVFETSQAFYALQLVSKEPAGVLPLAEARSIIEQRLRLEKQMDAAEARIREAAAGANGSLDALGSTLGTEVRAPEAFTRTDFVPVLGRQNRAVGTAFGMSPGHLSDPIRTDNAVVVLEVLEHVAADSTAFEAQKEGQRLALQQQEASLRLQEWLEGLRAEARIVDRRDEVLRPADEQPLPGTMGGPFGSR
ncbi:MAG: peptidylprolyl isomerase [Gemmatimonadota bacterium]